MKKIYIPTLNEWFEVTEEQYYGYYREIWATRKRAQYHGQCTCPKSKIWTCDGDCLVCPYRTVGNMTSLDYTYDNDENNSLEEMSRHQSASSDLDEMIADKISLEVLLEKLITIMPEAKMIGELRLQGLNDSAIAEAIGISRTTFLYRLKKAYAQIKKDFPEFF